MDGIKVMEREVLDGDAAHALDETKVLLDIAGLGVNGYEAEDWLIRNKTMTAGLSDERRVLLIFTLGTDQQSFDAMLSAFCSRNARYGASLNVSRSICTRCLPAAKSARIASSSSALTG